MAGLNGEMMQLINKAFRAYNWLAKRRLMKNRNVQIHPETTINTCYRINLNNGGSLHIGKGTVFDGNIVTEHADARICIGENCYIGNSRLISSIGIEIGNDVLISWGIWFYDHNSHAVEWPKRSMDAKRHYLRKPKDWSNVKRDPIKVCDRSWVGFNSIILKGVTIGEGAVVAAGSVVVEDVPPWTVVSGNPAKIIRKIVEKESNEDLG